MCDKDLHESTKSFLAGELSPEKYATLVLRHNGAGMSLLAFFLRQLPVWKGGTTAEDLINVLKGNDLDPPSSSVDQQE